MAAVAAIVPSPTSLYSSQSLTLLAFAAGRVTPNTLPFSTQQPASPSRTTTTTKPSPLKEQPKTQPPPPTSISVPLHRTPAQKAFWDQCRSTKPQFDKDDESDDEDEDMHVASPLTHMFASDFAEAIGLLMYRSVYRNASAIENGKAEETLQKAMKSNDSKDTESKDPFIARRLEASMSDWIQTMYGPKLSEPMPQGEDQARILMRNVLNETADYIAYMKKLCDHKANTNKVLRNERAKAEKQRKEKEFARRLRGSNTPCPSPFVVDRK